MRTLIHFVADSQQIPPEGLIVIGIICVLVGVWFSIAVFSDTLRGSVRWGEDGSGPPISRLGAVGWALTAYSFALLLFASALHWQTAYELIFYFVMALIFLTVVVALRDYARARNRI